MSGVSYNRGDNVEKVRLRQMIVDAAKSADIHPERAFTLPARFAHDVVMFREDWPELHVTCVERDEATAQLRDQIIRDENATYLVCQLNQFVHNRRITVPVSGPQIGRDRQPELRHWPRDTFETAPDDLRERAFQPHDIAFLDYTGQLNKTALNDCILFAWRFMKQRFVFAVTFSIANHRTRAGGTNQEQTEERLGAMFHAIKTKLGFEAEPVIEFYKDSTEMVFAMITRP